MRCRDKKAWLLKLFSIYFWLGVVLILLATVLQLQFPNANFHVQAGIVFLHTVGIAILVAAIFTFASGTSDFIDRITDLLRRIVIDREFLGNIDAESKRNALAGLIKPSEAERQLYADIGRYYDIFINHTMNITKRCVRSDYSVSARAYRDTDGTVAVEQRVSYRLHPTVEGYTNIEIRLDEKDLGSLFQWFRVSNPQGKVVCDELPEPVEFMHHGNLTYLCTVPLKDIGRGADHLKVQFCVVERGHDHWTHLCFQALEPTDGFTYYVQCEDDLHICALASFVHSASFKVYREGTRRIEVSCNEWFNEGTGLALVISNSEEEANKALQATSESAPGANSEAPEG